MKLNIIVQKFDTSNSSLIEGLPYVLEDTRTNERQIVTLSSCEDNHLVFSMWEKGGNSSGGPTKTIVLSPSDVANRYNIYKADLRDGMWMIFKDDSVSISSSPDISEETLKRIRDSLNNPPDEPIFLTNQQIIKDVFLNQNFNSPITGPINEENCPPTSATMCFRIIDYKNGISDGLTIGIENFYKVDTESGVTVIKQFLYKVTPVKDNENDQVQYEIVLPVSESDKKRYMDSGWKIHPMFYNKDNGCYMHSVVIKQRHSMDFTHEEKDSITIQILSGLQMLYLVEFGLNQNPNLGSSIYAGIKYEDGYVVISNAYTDEKNELFINNEYNTCTCTGVSVLSDSGYISRFMYWNENYDWLFLPKETTENPTMTDSYFAGPTRNLKNIILWGDEDSNAGIFRLWMYSTSTDGDEYIVPWEFGE